MKKNILLLIAMYCVNCYPVYSQCENEISTNPQGPYNTALPDLDAGAVPYVFDEKYLNGFDWIDGNHSPSTKEYVLTGMQYNPGQPYGNMANIQDPNLTGYYSYLNKVFNKEEMNTQNGWELMLINLGRYPDDVTPNEQTTLNVVPYLVFYNKYRGVLRVFVQYGYNEPPPNSVKGVKIDLIYDPQSPNISAILRLGAGIDKSLDQTTSVEILSAFAPKIAQQAFWMSTDFQLAYDPCVCDFESNIQLNFTFFSEQEFKLYGRGISTEESLINGNDIEDKGFLSNVDYSTGTGENGLIIYNRMEDLIDDYIAELEEYKQAIFLQSQINEEVEKNLKIAKAVSAVVKLGITFAVGTPAVLALQGNLSQYFFSDNSEKGKKAVENLFKKMEEILGKGMDTWVSKNFKAGTLPVEPEAPTAVFTEMHFDGQLISNSPLLGPIFNTPGSFVNNVDNSGTNTVLDLPVQPVYGYPVYNNPTGVFALLEKPKVVIADYFETDCYPIPNSDFYNHSLSSILQWKIDRELKFTINPALDIKNYAIKASIILKGDLRAPFDHNGQDRFVKNNPKYAVNVESQKFNVKDEDWIKRSDVQFESIFVPIDAFNSTTFSVGLDKSRGLRAGCEQPSWDPDRNFDLVYDTVLLKILLDVEFEGLNANGESNTGSYVFTYKVDLIDYINTPIYPNLPGSIGDLTQYQENLNFSNTIFDGSIIGGCNLNGNHYVCQAWNDVIISGSLTTSNNHTVEIFAGNTIQEFPESEVSPEIILAINPILDFSNPMPIATSEYVSNFCNSSLGDDAPKYLANRPNKNTSVMVNGFEFLDTKQNVNLLELSFGLYPNPAKNVTTVKLSREVIGATVQVYDLMGRESNVVIRQNGLSFDLDLTDLTTGVYLVKVSSIEGTITKTLIVK